MCADEQEIAEMDEEDKLMFLEDLGNQPVRLGPSDCCQLQAAGLNQLSYRRCKRSTGLDHYQRNESARRCQVKIHSDFERGFIRAEVVSFDDLKACGTYNAAKEKGLVRIEGKDYVVQDGDIMLFRFNV